MATPELKARISHMNPGQYWTHPSDKIGTLTIHRVCQDERRTGPRWLIVFNACSAIKAVDTDDELWRTLDRYWTVGWDG